MRKLFYFFALTLTINFIGCDTDEPEYNCDLMAHGVINDYNEFDGCGLIIISDTKTFEVLNWDELNFIPEDGMEVCFDYEIEHEAASICMLGEIIRLTECFIYD